MTLLAAESYTYFWLTRMVMRIIPNDYYALCALAVLIIIAVAFLIIGRVDLWRLFTRAPRLGTGLSRVWAVARTCLAEARAARLWVVPIVWFIACLILNLLLRPFDVSERIGLYIRVLLMSQEFVVMIAILLISVYSLPQERERRTIITTGAKPLSRLELILGKIVGFTVAAALLLLAMSILSLIFLYAANFQIKRQAIAEYQEQKLHYDNMEKDAALPQQSLLDLSEQGTLFANNYILSPRGVSVAGDINYETDPPTRLIKGNSQQAVYYHLPELPAGASNRPFFTFVFGYRMAPGATALPTDTKLDVTLTLQRDPRVSFEKSIKLTLIPGDNAVSQLYKDSKDVRAGGYQGVAFANMTPPDDATFFNYSPDIGAVGPVIIKIMFPEDNLYFGLIDNLAGKQSNVYVEDVDTTRTPDGSATIIPNFAPKVTGFEKRDYQQIAGPKKANDIPEVAYYVFHDVSAKDVPIDADGNFTLSANFDIDKNLHAEQQTHAVITLYRLFDAATNRIDVPITVEEKRDVLIKVPAHNLITDTPSDIAVAVRCLTSDHWLGVKNDSVRIYEPPSLFFVNFLKSEFVILCECALVVVIAVAASIRLGWPTAILLSGLIICLGYCFSFVQDLAGGSSNSLLNAATIQSIKGSAMYEIGSAATTGSTKGLYFLVNILPDFSKYDQISWIADSRNMPNEALGGDILLTLLYAVPIIAIAFFLIRKQELA